VLIAFETVRRYRLRARGIRTTAELVRFRVSVGDDGNPRYHPVMISTLLGGTQLEAESGEGTPFTPYGVKEGDRTEIIYDPAAPSSISLPSLEPKKLGASEILGLAAMSVAAGLVATVILVDVC
jgi:hypothetical protein